MTKPPYSRSARPGRRKGGPPFSMLVHAYFESPQFAALSDSAARLLVNLLCQYRGSNNGDLCASWKVMIPHGWNSKSMLDKALKELEGRGWVIQTRQGGRHAATLYALTFFGIDECDGKLDAGIKHDRQALHFWKHPDHMPAKKRSLRGFGKAESVPLGNRLDTETNVVRLRPGAGEK